MLLVAFVVVLRLYLVLLISSTELLISSTERGVMHVYFAVSEKLMLYDVIVLKKTLC